MNVRLIKATYTYNCMYLYMYMQLYTTLLLIYLHIHSLGQFIVPSVHVLRHVRWHVRVSTYVQNPQHEQKITRAKSLSIVQSRVPNRKFVVATATLMTVTFCIHNFASSCFTLNETLYMLQHQEILYFTYTICGSHVPFQIIQG